MIEHSPHPSPYLLVVEDSDEDFEAFEWVLHRHCALEVPFQRCTDGEDALDFLLRRGDHRHSDITTQPSVILLDLNLPGTDGRELLAEIKQDDQLKDIPVVIFTTSSSPRDVEFCYRHDIHSYMVKPLKTESLKQTLITFFDYWFNTVLLPEPTSC